MSSDVFIAKVFGKPHPDAEECKEPHAETNKYFIIRLHFLLIMLFSEKSFLICLNIQLILVCVVAGGGVVVVVVSCVVVVEVTVVVVVITLAVDVVITIGVVEVDVPGISKFGFSANKTMHKNKLKFTVQAQLLIILEIFVANNVSANYLGFLDALYK